MALAANGPIQGKAVSRCQPPSALPEHQSRRLDHHYDELNDANPHPGLQSSGATSHGLF